MRPKPACTSSKISTTLVLLAPLGQLLHVFHRREVGPDALVGFHHHAGDVLRLQAALGSSAARKTLEAGVLLPVAVGEGRVDDGRVFVDDPALLPGHAAGLLRAERAPVKAALEADDADLLLAADLDAVRARELDGAFGGLRAGGEQEDFLQSLGRDAGRATRPVRRALRWGRRSCAAGRC